jgi:hypothetical protein
MDATLARRLIEQGAIRLGTEINALYPVSNLTRVTEMLTTGIFSITRCGIANGRPVFEVYDIRDGSKRIIPCERLIGIDGMSPERYAAIYNLDTSGNFVRPPKRRGRRPRNWPIGDELCG